MSKLNKPISGKDILKWVPNAIVLKYSELKNYSHLPPLPIVLLYEVGPNFGHWVTILKTPQGIEHFDSYGYAPDQELNFVPDEYKSDITYLLRFLYNSNKDINYNPYPLQKGLKTATCGRWVILRNLFDYLTTDEFYRTVDKTAKELNLSHDELVSFVI